MAYFSGNFRSRILVMDTSLDVIVPYEQYYIPSNDPTRSKTLILLHGLKQNASVWSRLSRAEMFAYATGFNIVIPEVQRSFYANQKHGLDYFDYITEEVPEIASKIFGLNTDGDHLYIGGLSMGGYGALKCALTYPQRYAGAMSFSGGFRVLKNYRQYQDLLPESELVATLGQDLQCEPENDLEYLAKRAAAAPKKPKIYLACGTEDFLYDDNVFMRGLLDRYGFDLQYEEWPGIHNWKFWDRALGRSMASASGLPLDALTD